MQEKLMKLCGLYRNVSQKSGKEYFSGNLTLFTRVLIFENPNRQTDKDPTHILYLTEREPKDGNGQKKDAQTYPQAGDHGGIAGGDWPRRRGGAF